MGMHTVYCHFTTVLSIWRRFRRIRWRGQFVEDCNRTNKKFKYIYIYDKYHNLFDLEELFFFINAPGKAGAMPRSPNSQKFLQVKKDNLGI